MFAVRVAFRQRSPFVVLSLTFTFCRCIFVLPIYSSITPGSRTKLLKLLMPKTHIFYLEPQVDGHKSQSQHVTALRFSRNLPRRLQDPRLRPAPTRPNTAPARLAAHRPRPPIAHFQHQHSIPTATHRPQHPDHRHTNRTTPHHLKHPLFCPHLSSDRLYMSNSPRLPLLKSLRPHAHTPALESRPNRIHARAQDSLAHGVVHTLGCVA